MLFKRWVWQVLVIDTFASSFSYLPQSQLNGAHVSYLSVHCTSSSPVVRKRTTQFFSFLLYRKEAKRYGIHKTFADCQNVGVCVCVCFILFFFFFLIFFDISFRLCSLFSFASSNLAPKIGKSLWFIIRYWKFFSLKMLLFLIGSCYNETQFYSIHCHHFTRKIPHQIVKR